MKKSGFTLMELLVYIAIMGIVVVVAGQAFSDSTRMRVRTENMLKASQIAENVGSIFKEDVAQMGAKSAYDATASNAIKDAFKFLSNVYMDPSNATENLKDSSSFRLTKNKFGNGFDSLTMRRIKYTLTGEYERVEEIGWYAKENILKRSCKVIDGDDENNECVSEIEIANDITRFSIIPAKPNVLSSDYASATSAKQYPRLLPSKTDTSVHSFQLVARNDMENDFYYMTATTSNDNVGLSGFTTNYDFDADEIIANGRKTNQLYVVGGSTVTSGTWNELCTNIDSLQAGIEYEISFEIPFVANNSRVFCPGRDHMAVGFRYKEDGSIVDEIDDFLFYPPAVGTASPIRTMRFSPSVTIKNVCMAFTFVSYSPIASTASMSIKSLELKKVETANYEFDESYEPTNILDKRNIKAVRLQLQVKKSREAGEISLDIPTPSNGPRD